MALAGGAARGAFARAGGALRSGGADDVRFVEAVARGRVGVDLEIRAVAVARDVHRALRDERVRGDGLQAGDVRLVDEAANEVVEALRVGIGDVARAILHRD